MSNGVQERSLQQSESGRKIRFLWAIWTAFCLLFIYHNAFAQQKFVTEYQLDRDVVNVNFEYKDHQIFVTGQAGDQKNLTFLFDSGASAPVLDKKLGLHGPHLGDSVIQEAEGTTPAESMWLNELSVGPDGNAVKASSISVLVTDLSQLSHLLGRRLDGIIGVTFMSGFVTEIDYDKHIMSFHRPTDFTISRHAVDNKKSFLFDLKNSNPARTVSSVLLKGLLHPKYDYDFLLDTGFGGYVSVTHQAAEESGILRKDTPRVPAVAYGVTRKFQSDKIRAPFLKVGDIDLSNKIITVDYRNNDAVGQTGIVGNRFLQNYHVTLDYPRHKLLLERAMTTEEEDDAGRPSFGLIIRADGKSIRIDRVKRYSPAQQSGIHPGDQIMAINGVSLQGMPTAQVVTLLTTAHGQTDFQVVRAVDPNLGTGGDTYSIKITPVAPLEWQEK